MSSAVQAALANANSRQAALMQEHVCLVDQSDAVIGAATKAEAHWLTKGTLPLHRAFSVFLFDSSNRMLIQQRSSHKLTFPGYWANACCSHPLYNLQELGIVPETVPQQEQQPAFVLRSTESSSAPASNPSPGSASNHNQDHNHDHNQNLQDSEELTSARTAQQQSSNNTADSAASHEQESVHTAGQPAAGIVDDPPPQAPQIRADIALHLQGPQDPFLGVRRAAQRKLVQELGIPEDAIKLDDLSLLTRIRYQAMYEETNWGEHELDYVLFCRADLSIKADPNEVQHFRFVSEYELRELFRCADGALHAHDNNAPKICPWFRLIVDKYGWTWWEQLTQIGPQAVLALQDEVIHDLQ